MKNEEWYKYLNENERKKIELAKNYIKSYIAARDGLKKLGIVRTNRNLDSEYGEWLASKILDLELADSTVQEAYDAKKDGKTYQIKTRIVKSLDEDTSFDFNNIEKKFDYLIGVFLSKSTFDLLGIIQVPYEVVKELGNQTKRNFRFRWNRKTASDDRIKWVYLRKIDS